MSATVGLRRTRLLATAALVTAVVTSISALPDDVLPWPWLCALVVPAALLGLRRRPPRRPFLRALLATALQLSACMLAYEVAGPIARPAALAGTILPPMVFVTVRRQDVDATLGLFLSFCVLLVGAILGEAATWHLGLYVLAAAMQLRCETRLAALRESHLPLRPGGRLASVPALSGLALGALCALAALAVQRSLPLLPSLSRASEPAAAPAGRPARSVGLPDSFVLDGGLELLDLQGERLIEVDSLDDGEVPEDLYLRSAWFQVPGLDSWDIGSLSPERFDTSRRRLHLREPLAGWPLRRIEVVRLAGSRNLVFAPPEPCSITGLPDLLVDRRREWFREPSGRGGDVYEVAFQELPAAPLDRDAEERWRTPALLGLPAGFEPQWFRVLLDGWQPRGSPMQKADRIAAGLGARCTYVRREPVGPHRSVLLNFLHGERTGFCMHFASAAAILLRMCDVPCRIAVGLYGGERAQNGRTYGSQHAHAWVEIPLEGRGWVVFDPTPPADRGRAAPPGAMLPAAGEDDGAGAGGGDASALAAFVDLLRGLSGSPWPWVVLIALLVLPLRRPDLRERPAPALLRAARPARRWLLRILRELAVRGRPRPHGATLEQHARALERSGALPADLRQAFAAYQEVRFGGRPWDARQEERMQKGLLAARGLPGPGQPGTADPLP